MDTTCLCGHDDTEHARNRAHCRALDSYGITCTCPRWVPDDSCPEHDDENTSAAPHPGRFLTVRPYGGPYQ